MPRVNMAVEHQLGQEEALRRLKERGEFVERAYGDQVRDLKQDWEGNRLSFGFTAMGMRIAGTALVEASQVLLTTEIPLMAMMFKGAIEQRVRAELGEVLA